MKHKIIVHHIYFFERVYVVFFMKWKRENIYYSILAICLGTFLCAGFIIKTRKLTEYNNLVYGEKEIEESVATGGKAVSGDRKTAYLTFDDGPSSLTDEVLDILSENDVKATFFLIGNQINKRTKKTLKRMVSEGHDIGIHTYCHEADCIYETEETYYKDVLKTKKCIKKYTGLCPVYYRFPWGSVNGYIKKYRKSIINRLEKEGLYYCDWNVSGEDSIGSPSSKEIINNVKMNYDMYDEPVILLHDAQARKETVKALPTIIKMYKDAGYSFDVISNRKCPYQWKPYK